MFHTKKANWYGLMAAAAICSLATAAANAQCDPQEVLKYLADDGAEGDYFGNSAAISGTTIIIGAPFDDARGEWSGSAYIFDLTSPSQIVKLVPDDGATEDRFGGSAAISGDIAIIGAGGDDDNGNNSGSAYLFNASTGQQIAKLLPDDGAAGHNFGFSVAISGTTAIVGATGNSDFGDHSGAAYLFDTTTGQQIAKLLPDDGQILDHFGAAVAIDGNTAIVTATWDDDNGTESGSAYIFDVSDPANPVQTGKFTPEDGAPFDFFGTEAAIDNDIAIVTSWQDDDLGEWSGSAYLFNTEDGQQIAKLLPDDGAARDFFGNALAIHGEVAIVGAKQFDGVGTDSGSAYLFRTTNGHQIAKLTPDDNEPYDNFGSAVAINDDAVIVGARKDDDNGLDSGSVYVFECACPPDWNGDTTLNTQDFMAFLNDFVAGDADYNGDTVTNTIDFMNFLNDYIDGC